MFPLRCLMRSASFTEFEVLTDICLSLQSAAGISFKSQFLYLLVYVTRYLDLLWTFYLPSSLYNTCFKIVFLASSGYTVYLMLNDFKPTHDPNQDTFKVQYLLAFSAAMAILFPYKYTFTELLWAFSIWLESVAILPQLFPRKPWQRSVDT